MMMSMMPTQGVAKEALLTDHALAAGESKEVIASRFGEITIDRRNALFFPKGMLGLPQRQRFALAEFPNEQMRKFKLLQSLEDEKLAFIVLPLPLENAIMRAEDLHNASRDLATRPEDLVVLLVVCVHRDGGGTRLSVNARAPVLIDTLRKTGMQYVFMQDHYPVQYYIT